MRIEICVEGIEAVKAATDGGADRVELCENLAVGGVTPSAGQIELACVLFPGPVHVLIRPRGGNFIYSDLEFEVMRRDLARARDLGAKGVVLGVLNTSGQIDRERCARLLELARPMSVTFHRAFDELADQEAGLGTLISLGFDRVLTGGGKGTVRDGLARLEALNRAGQGRIGILAGGRCTVEELPRLGEIGIPEAHLGSGAHANGHTDAGAVARIMRAARHAGPVTGNGRGEP